MEVNNIPTPQNNTAANASTAVLQAEKSNAESQKVTPAKEGSDTGNDVNRQSFDQESIVKEALQKRIIKDEKEIFNFRVTRFASNLTFTNVASGEVTNVGISETVGDSVIDANI